MNRRRLWRKDALQRLIRNHREDGAQSRMPRDESSIDRCKTARSSAGRQRSGSATLYAWLSGEQQLEKPQRALSIRERMVAASARAFGEQSLEERPFFLRAEVCEREGHAATARARTSAGVLRRRRKRRRGRTKTSRRRPGSPIGQLARA